MTKEKQLGNQFAIVTEWGSEITSEVSKQVKTMTQAGKVVFIFTDEHKFEGFPRPLEQELLEKNGLATSIGTTGAYLLTHMDTLDDFLNATDIVDELLERGKDVKLFIDVRDYNNLKRIVKLTSLMAQVYTNLSVTYTVHTKRNYLSAEKTTEDIVRELPMRVAPENIILL